MPEGQPISGSPASVSPTETLSRALRPLRFALIVAGLFSAAINLLVLALPIYILQVFDRVLTGRSVETLVALTILILGLLGLQAALDMVRGTLLRRAAAGMEMRLSALVMGAALAAGARGAAHPGAGPADLREVCSAISAPHAPAVFDLPWAPAFLAVIFLMHPVLGGFAAGALVLLMLLALATLRAARAPRGTAAQRQIAAGQDAVDYLRNAEAVAGLGMGQALAHRWARTSAGLAHVSGRVNAAVAGVLSVTRFARMSIQAGIIGLGAWLAISGQITPGAMIAASILMGRALAPAEQAVGSWKGWADGWAAFRRLRVAVRRMPRNGPATDLPCPSGQLALDGVAYTAPSSGKTILEGVSLTVPAGGSLGIIGPSGAGKSTLARLIAGVWAPSEGRVTRDGADLAQWSRDRLGAAVGYLPQDVQLLAGTVAENIARFRPDADSDDILAAACGAAVHEMIVGLPDGYDTEIGRGGVALSGGQRQRLGLARALFGDPSLLVLDEPNANLDPEGEAALIAAMEAAADRGATVIVVSHSASMLRVVREVIVLRDGRVRTHGPRDRIVARLRTAAAQGRAQGAGA